MDSGPCWETALEAALVKVVLGCIVRNGLVWKEGPRECEGKELVG